MKIIEQTEKITQYMENLMKHVLKLGYEYRCWWNYNDELQSFYIVLRIGEHDSGTPRGFYYRAIERYTLYEYIKSIQDPEDGIFCGEPYSELIKNKIVNKRQKEKLILYVFIFAMMFAVSLYEFNLEESPGYDDYAKFIEEMSNESEFFKETLKMVKQDYKDKPLNLWGPDSDENDCILIHSSDIQKERENK